jgi:hypothetical protein
MSDKQNEMPEKSGAARNQAAYRARQDNKREQAIEDRIEHRLLLDWFRGAGAGFFDVDPGQMLGEYSVQSRYLREHLGRWLLAALAGDEPITLPPSKAPAVTAKPKRSRKPKL